jgi:hypothetical protein
MSLERKVGQLMSVAFRGRTITSSLEAMIRDRGVVFAIGAGMRDFA